MYFFLFVAMCSYLNDERFWNIYTFGHIYRCRLPWMNGPILSLEDLHRRVQVTLRRRSVSYCKAPPIITATVIIFRSRLLFPIKLSPKRLKTRQRLPAIIKRGVATGWWNVIHATDASKIQQIDFQNTRFVTSGVLSIAVKDIAHNLRP